MRYAVIIEKGPKSYGAYVPDLPGCVARGRFARRSHNSHRGSHGVSYRGTQTGRAFRPGTVVGRRVRRRSRVTSASRQRLTHGSQCLKRALCHKEMAVTQEEHMTSTPTKVDYDIMLPLVCEEHYEYSALLCCPFPGCPNGTSSEEIEAAAPLLEPKVYRRAVWTDEEGEKSYSWEHELPLLFSLPRVMWRESMRK